MGKQKLTTEQYIDKANEVHKGKYLYDKTEYINSRSKVCITCPTHGDFWQNASSHLMGVGCPKCANLHHYNTREFIDAANIVHNGKYDYSKTEYANSQTKICVICPIHGEFWATPNHHLNGVGCPKCANNRVSEKLSISKDKFIELGKEVHNSKYSYCNVDYKNNRTKVCIICPVHGEFWQIPYHHLKGCGCPKCKQSKLELELYKELQKRNIEFLAQYNSEWLGKQSLDFYLPQYNVAIECQGIQHFNPVAYFGGTKRFEENQERDRLKKELCEQNGVKLLYYSNLKEYHEFLGEKVFHDAEELIDYIVNNRF